jgi:hypothetical protein
MVHSTIQVCYTSEMIFSDKVKVWLTCPKAHADEVRMVIGDAGFGKIGNYSHCSFVTEGKGYSKALDGANPNIGEVGQITEIEEVVIEFVCHKVQLPLLKEILKEHHPYEEVAVDVFTLIEF